MKKPPPEGSGSGSCAGTFVPPAAAGAAARMEYAFLLRSGEKPDDGDEKHERQQGGHG